MSTIAQKLTLAEFEQQYGHEKPYYEFWDGQAVQKCVPTWLHGLLQGILIELLAQSGYKAGSEVKLKVDTGFQPIPDVIATHGRVELPYPTKAVEIVIEILSEEDPMSRVLTKCRAYEGWGFEQVYVIDPEARIVFCWAGHQLEEVSHVDSISVDRIWTALDQELR